MTKKKIHIFLMEYIIQIQIGRDTMSVGLQKKIKKTVIDVINYLVDITILIRCLHNGTGYDNN